MMTYCHSETESKLMVIMEDLARKSRANGLVQMLEYIDNREYGLAFDSAIWIIDEFEIRADNTAIEAMKNLHDTLQLDEMHENKYVKLIESHQNLELDHH